MTPRADNVVLAGIRIRVMDVSTLATEPLPLLFAAVTLGYDFGLLRAMLKIGEPVDRGEGG